MLEWFISSSIDVIPFQQRWLFWHCLVWKV